MTDNRSSTDIWKLRRCPFCGLSGYSLAPVHGVGHEVGEKFHVARIECVCGAHGPTMKREKASAANAAAAWNNRSVDVAQEAAVCGTFDVLATVDPDYAASFDRTSQPTQGGDKGEAVAWLYEMAFYIKPADENPLRDWKQVVTITPPPTIPAGGVRNVEPLYRGSAYGWQDISTAPRDGTRLILAWDDSASLPMHWEVGRYRSGAGAGSGWCNTYNHKLAGEPTHWMLPAVSALPSTAPETTRNLVESLCDDCPPVGYETDKTRCLVCPRRSSPVPSTDREGGK